MGIMNFVKDTVELIKSDKARIDKFIEQKQQDERARRQSEFERLTIRRTQLEKDNELRMKIRDEKQKIRNLKGSSQFDSLFSSKTSRDIVIGMEPMTRRNRR
jgi:type II secretory pathway component PulK